MRLLEILSFFKALVAAEFRGLFAALPLALEAFRDAFVATVDYCASGFTCSDVTVRTRTKRRSCRSSPYRSRQRSAIVTPRRPDDGADEDWLFPHLRHRRTRTSLAASFLESGTPSNMMMEFHVDEYLAEDDIVTKSSVCLSSCVSDDDDAETEEEDDDPVPPLLPVEDDEWDAVIPRVPGVAADRRAALTPEWNTDWKQQNVFSLLHAPSSTSTDASLQHSTTDEPVTPVSTEEELVCQLQADEEPEASLASEELSLECIGVNGPITTNVSYRQLTQDHAAVGGESFYRTALQRLKHERQLRRRLRASSEAWSITSSTSESASIQQLPTGNEADDETKRVRREKLALLRRQRTGFEIRVGCLKETSDVVHAERSSSHSRSSTMSQESDAAAEAPVAYV